MKILLINKMSLPLSLDIPMEDGRAIRGIIPVSGSLDVGDILEADEANQNPLLRQLYAEGKIEIRVESDAGDIPALMEAEGGTLPLGVPATFEMEKGPRWKYTNPSLYTLYGAPEQNQVLARIMLPDYTVKSLTLPATFDPSVSGPGGLDAGSEANDTWYYVYVAPTTPTADTLVVIGSVNPPSPLGTGPTGYPNARYMGAFRNNTAGDLIPVICDGISFQYPGSRVVADMGAAEIATEGAPVSMDLSNFVPQTAGSAYLRGILSSGVGGNGKCVFFVDGYTFVQRDYLPSRDDGYSLEYSEFPVPTVPKRIWRQFEEDPIVGLDSFKMICLGWYDSWLQWV